jgi:hypothetical protein
MPHHTSHSGVQAGSRGGERRGRSAAISRRHGGARSIEARAAAAYFEDTTLAAARGSSSILRDASIAEVDFVSGAQNVPPSILFSGGRMLRAKIINGSLI